MNRRKDKIAFNLHVSGRSVRRWLRHFRLHGDVNRPRQQRSGRKPDLLETHLIILRQLIEEDSSFMLHELHDRIEQ
jgi:transposase